MRPAARLVFTLTSAAIFAAGAASDLDLTLHAIENRYNHAQSLKLDFSESFLASKRPTQTESGVLYLRKPGRMRWEYTSPAGKIFLADGKDTFLYTPDNRRAEKAPLKLSEDDRAPLAFLLGKLDFHKDFQSFESHTESGNNWIAARPKSQNLPYNEVEFLATPDGQIHKIRVTNQDQSKLEYTFSNEQLNAAVAPDLFVFRPPAGVEIVEAPNKMAEFQLQYADTTGQVHNQVVQGTSDQEVRERFSRQGYLVYGVKAKGAGLVAGLSLSGRKKLNLEKFLIFNQQFVTLIRAGLPILKSLDLLAERLTDPKLRPYINAVRDDVRKGALLSDAFRTQEVFPKIYVTSVMAGEKSGSLVEVLERYVTYQKLALGVRKKVLVSLMYPSVLIVLVLLLMVFLVTYVVPSFASLYSSMSAQLPAMTLFLIAIGTSARSYILAWVGGLLILGIVFVWWSRGEAARERLDRIRIKIPVLGDIWLKYQVAQFSRVLSTLLTGGIPLVHGLETSADSLGTPLLRKTLAKAGQKVREGQALSGSLAATGVFPPLSVDMIEVGESTGALPSMLSSVAEFYEDDVNTKMTAVLSMIEPAIMIFMGMFVAFILISLYLPIFSLADTIK